MEKARSRSSPGRSTARRMSSASPGRCMCFLHAELDVVDEDNVAFGKGWASKRLAARIGCSSRSPKLDATDTPAPSRSRTATASMNVKNASAAGHDHRNTDQPPTNSTRPNAVGNSRCAASSGSISDWAATTRAGSRPPPAIPGHGPRRPPDHLLQHVAARPEHRQCEQRHDEAMRILRIMRPASLNKLPAASPHA